MLTPFKQVHINKNFKNVINYVPVVWSVIVTVCSQTQGQYLVKWINTVKYE